MSKAKCAKLIKVTYTILMILVLVSIFSNSVSAAVDANTIFSTMSSSGETPASTDIAKVGGTIVNVITTVGVVASVIVLVILGIKYMIGSASEKADYKKSMIPYLVGAILVFGASAIAKIAVGFANNISTN